eukprot:scaffold15068_cov193-Alexandrium_tamarense.AAC.3
MHPVLLSSMKISSALLLGAASLGVSSAFAPISGDNYRRNIAVRSTVEDDVVTTETKDAVSSHAAKSRTQRIMEKTSSSGQ